MNQITLSTVDLEKIQRIVDKFDITEFELIKDSSTGIGYTLDITFWTNVNGLYCQVVVPLVNTEEW
jgi:hypothetical protein